MAGGYSKRMMDTVFAALPVANAAAVTSAELHTLVGKWALGSVKFAVAQLVEEGRAEQVGQHPNLTFRRAKT